jgi:hypothetical protein
MSSRKRLLCIVWMTVLVVAAGAGCGNPVETPTPTPTQPPNLPAEVLAARDAALDFLRQIYPDKAPLAGIGWAGRDTTPPGTPGLSSYEFTSGNWLMTVWIPVLSVQTVIYEMALDNQDIGLRWVGKLREDYTVLESNLNVSFDVLVVRDLVLFYYRENYGADAPPEGLVWVGERTTPEGSVGHEWCQFTAGVWSMAVDYEVARPEQVLYHVELRNSDTGVLWRCQVDAQGQILEIQGVSRQPA